MKQTEIKTELNKSKDTPESVLNNQNNDQSEKTVIDISGCASFEFGKFDGKVHKFLNRKKIRKILNENASGNLSKEEIEEIVTLISLLDFTLDKKEDVQVGETVTMNFAPNDKLQNLTNSMGLELKFSEISKIFQTTV